MLFVEISPIELDRFSQDLVIFFFFFLEREAGPGSQADLQGGV